MPCPRRPCLVTEVTDAFGSGDRVALRLVCRYPSGGEVVCNALVDVDDGRIARFSGVQARDESAGTTARRR